MDYNVWTIIQHVQNKVEITKKRMMRKMHEVTTQKRIKNIYICDYEQLVVTTYNSVQNEDISFKMIRTSTFPIFVDLSAQFFYQWTIHGQYSKHKWFTVLKLLQSSICDRYAMYLFSKQHEELVGVYASQLARHLCVDLFVEMMELRLNSR